MPRKLSAKIKAFHLVFRFIAIPAVVAVLTGIVSPAASAQSSQARQRTGVSAKSNSANLSASDISFFLPVVTYSSGGFEPYSIAVADVNLDGKADVLVLNICANNSSGNCSADGSVGVLLGNGNGTFQPAVEYDSGGALAISLAIADVNGDRRPDLLVTNYYYNLEVLLGNGDGTFQTAVVYDTGGQFPTSVAAADVNGDTKPDLVV